MPAAPARKACCCLLQAQRIPDDAIFVSANQGRFQVWWVAIACVPSASSAAGVALGPPPSKCALSPPLLQRWFDQCSRLFDSLRQAAARLTAVCTDRLRRRLQQGADLSDPATTLASHGIAEFAVQHGLLTPGEPFNFLKAFVSDLPADALYNYPRVCAVHEMLAGIDNATCWGEAPYFKVFPAPPAKLSVHSVMAALRNHYDFTPWDP